MGYALLPSFKLLRDLLQSRRLRAVRVQKGDDGVPLAIVDGERKT